MKKIPLLLAAVVSVAGTSTFAQPVVARGQVLLTGCSNAEPLRKPALVPADQVAQAGQSGAVLFYENGSRLGLSRGSEFAVYGGNPPLRPVFEAPLENLDATSAIKSINTQRIGQVFRNGAEQAVVRDGLELRSGRVLVDRRASSVEVRVMKATIAGADARFAVAEQTPGSARLTVAEGTVTVAVPGEAPQTVNCGQFVILSSDACGRTYIGDPRAIGENALARADQSDLVAGYAGRLEPVGECVDLAGDLDPVCEMVGVLPSAFSVAPAVGTGPSVPFDLSGGILSSPNGANVGGPVQSPEVP